MITCHFEKATDKSALRHVTTDVIVSNDKGQILLVQRSLDLSEGGKYAIPGGYLDRDELIENAGKREVLEETGYECGPLTLLGIASDPLRPGNDRQDISFVFFAQCGNKVQEPDEESLSVDWFDLDKLPPNETIAFDHLHFINLYKSYVEKPFQLPATDNL